MTEFTSAKEAFEAGRQDGARECLEVIKTAKAESSARMMTEWESSAPWSSWPFAAVVGLVLLVVWAWCMK